jgi:hypothetical protein
MPSLLRNGAAPNAGAEEWSIVEETLRPGASVARNACQRGINAYLVFLWRKAYREGMLPESKTKRPHKLLVGIASGDIVDTNHHANGVTGQVYLPFMIHDALCPRPIQDGGAVKVFGTASVPDTTTG